MTDKETSFDNKVEMITRQTNYTIEEAREKLISYDNDEIKVIKHFLGVKEKTEKPITSINQEIYKQLRYKMNASIKDYNNKNTNESISF